MKALIIEDEPITARLIAESLEGICEVHVTSRSEEAFQQLVDAFEEGAPFDLITLDLTLPGLGGDEFLDELRWYEIESGVVEENAAKVVVISSQDLSGDYSGVLSGVCDAFLPKPIDRSKLQNEIRRLCLAS